MRFPFTKQLDTFDCGPTCLQMVSEFYGKKIDLDFLREQCYITREGVSLLGISQAAERIGFRTLMVKIGLDSLAEDVPMPVILHWNQEHFVVLYKIRNKGPKKVGTAGLEFIIADPAHGLTRIKSEDFLKFWQTSEGNKGIALLLEPTAAFYDRHNYESVDKSDLRFLLSYLKPFRKSVLLLALCMMASVGITICLPYLTQGLIDKGIVGKNYAFIVLFVLSQFILYTGGTALDVFRGWILLHMNAKISLNIISDFLKKLMRLPIRFFDSKSVGDVSQRINDHHKIETFLTSDIISTLFSSLQIIVLSSMLFTYKFSIWATFICFSASAVLWMFLFQKKRKQLDYVRFTQSKATQEKLFELIVGMQEIKLYNGEQEKRWEWEFLQVRQYRLNIKGLKLEQYQQTGFFFLSHIKNVVISFLSAVAVMHGELTIGVMLSISFIIGQTNGPLQQLIQFFKSAQDANLSFSRLQEVHHKDDEEQGSLPESELGTFAPLHDGIYLKRLNFQYQGPRSPFVLRDLDVLIPKGKITAIVGASGSGKTTLMKLLLGFYQPTDGAVMIGDQELSELSPKLWRSHCGTVMQDGYLFNDTIARNIVVDGSFPDTERFNRAVYVSNIDEFVNQLPLGYNTKIGPSGVGLSGGQKQRILIARAVYKDPAYLFFDEATSSLDAGNETAIMDRLDTFFIGKTVVVIAHRLSTVRHADQIIVLEKGMVVETGNHESLTTNRGAYYDLVKNQLELGA
ncbi:peptidase domain-containing ABC transporter [Mucilaginibacter sp. SJ]|uniref:peptidase domain-containing ABC transporter n=1 Tax=Mucilaginibacter sp. SJ TaxID=3029053 RepID=UPI0023A9FE75|nr:peptidase domain-containing ABC transporter [Mucilaginibacter sp. SJ]WEA03864.1 peptidase domain-containing ABC transporter [Mucilaginibacter sp. SJ]